MPRAKGQPIQPKKVNFCLECLAAGFHRAGCPIAKKEALGEGRRRVRPAAPKKQASIDVE